MFELFSDIMACRETLFSRIDARVRLIGALSALVAVLCSTQPILPLAVLIAGVSCMLLLRLPLKLTLLRLAAPLMIVSILVLLQTFMYGSRPLWSFACAGITFTAREEGAWRGALLGSRVLGAVSVMLLLSSVTPAHQIFHALRWMGAPKTWVEVALLMYRYVFVLLDEAADVETAQRVRLGYTGVRRSLSSLGALSGTVLVRSLDQSQRTHQAMMLRGYKGYLVFGPLRPLRTRERLLLLVLPLTMAGAFYVAEYLVPPLRSMPLAAGRQP
ncbi:MAG TPA: cobalt ECF transporter T component CbiQ [Planctomycetota bacterium]|jgi:cobalt/nickel transport system permease protein